MTPRPTKQTQTLDLNLEGRVTYEILREDRVVEVRVEEDGRPYSAVRYEPLVHPAGNKEVILDRTDRRGPLSPDTVISRAKLLARLMGLRYVENLEVPCVVRLGRWCECGSCRQARARRLKDKAEK